MEKVLEAVASQVPDLAVLLFIVIMFLKYLEKRDAIIQEFTAAMTKELKTMAGDLRTHTVQTADAIDEMRRLVYDKREAAEPE